MFKITRGKGFSIKFKNGYKISVQFGGGNYCNNYDMNGDQDDRALGREGCHNSEIAIIDPKGEFVTPDEWDDMVKGHCSSEEVLKWMNYTANIKIEDKKQ